jgi:phosphate transport system substrate-binding protein
MMGKQYVFIGLLGILALCAAACKSKKSILMDSPVNGSINISIDESFKPVMDAQVKMYEASNPAVKLNVHYKPEADCLKDLLRDTATRMVIVTRRLSEKEEKFLADSMEYKPRWDGLATDAIAVIVPIGSSDTLFTVEDLRNRLSGKSAKKNPIVLDGLSATSTVRFARDSIMEGKLNFDSSVVRAVKSSSEVINYVAATPGSIGMVGISWIGNPEDTAQLKLLKKVKIAYLRCDRCDGKPYVKPTQASIMEKRYPLVRALYYILKENYTGLGSGFVGFLQYERGQLIFRRAYLAPGKMGFGIRHVKINEKLRKD